MKHKKNGEIYFQNLETQEVSDVNPIDQFYRNKFYELKDAHYQKMIYHQRMKKMQQKYNTIKQVQYDDDDDQEYDQEFDYDEDDSNEIQDDLYSHSKGVAGEKDEFDDEIVNEEYENQNHIQEL